MKGRKLVETNAPASTTRPTRNTTPTSTNTPSSSLSSAPTNFKKRKVPIQLIIFVFSCIKLHFNYIPNQT